jgi:hypothetical protein
VIPPGREHKTAKTSSERKAKRAKRDEKAAPPQGGCFDVEGERAPACRRRWRAVGGVPLTRYCASGST